MAIPLVVNGVTFQYPQQFDKNWGPTLTNWSSAVTSGMLQKAGGSFPLTAEVDFGGSFGVKVLSVKSEESNIAQTGFVRLANASSGIVWRNASNGADLPLTVNASNQLTFNGTSIGATTALTDGHILVGNVSNQPADVAMSGDITITRAGVTSIGAGKVLNANVGASAAISWTKLASGTPYSWLTLDSGGVITGTSVTAARAVVTDPNGVPSASAVTSAELGFVGGVTSAIQTQIDGKVSKSGDTMSGNLNMGSNKIVSMSPGSGAGEAATYAQLPGPAGTITNWATLAGVTYNGLGTTTNETVKYRRVGDTISLHITLTVGTLSASTAYIALPVAIVIDSAKVSSPSAPGTAVTTRLGMWIEETVGLQNIFSGNHAGPLFWDGVDNTKLFFATQTNANAYLKQNASTLIAGPNLDITIEFPVVGWSI